MPQKVRTLAVDAMGESFNCTRNARYFPPEEPRSTPLRNALRI